MCYSLVEQIKIPNFEIVSEFWDLRLVENKNRRIFFVFFFEKNFKKIFLFCIFSLEKYTEKNTEKNGETSEKKNGEKWENERKSGEKYILGKKSVNYSEVFCKIFSTEFFCGKRKNVFLRKKKNGIENTKQLHFVI